MLYLDWTPVQKNEKEKLFSEELFLNRRVFEDKIECPIDVGVRSREQDNDNQVDIILDNP